MGPLERLARGLVGSRLLLAALLCGLTWWFASMTGTYRPAGPALSHGFAVGTVLFVVTLALVFQRLVTSEPPAPLRAILDQLLRFAPVIVLNLILINLLTPFLLALSPLLLALPLGPLGWLLTRQALLFVSTVSSQVLFACFVAGVAGLVALLLVRGFDRVAEWDSAARRLAAGAGHAVIAAAAVYCLFGMALVLNGSLDTSPVAAHRSEIVRTGGFRGPFGLMSVWWVEVRSWRRPDAVERVTLFPGRDQLRPGRVGAGTPVLLDTRRGVLGLTWVERIRLDHDQHLARLVEAVPTAPIPRKRLVNSLVSAGRWPEAVAEMREYVRHHPGDRAAVEALSRFLRAAGQHDSALALEGGESPPVTGPRR